MAKAEASVDELVSMIEHGELRLPEMQRRYVWRATRVRDLLDSLYRNYPSGAILLWDATEEVPLRDFAITQTNTPLRTTRLLLDGQQRLTSLAAVLRGHPVNVRGRKRPIEILFNLDHPNELPFAIDHNNDSDNDNDTEDDNTLTDDLVDSNEDELQQRFNRMTFVVATRKLEQQPNWVRVTEVFKNTSDHTFLKRAGVTSLDDPRYQEYAQRLTRLRNIRNYIYRMDILERHLSYNEVTEIFVRVNSLGAKLRSSDLALAQITAKWRGSLKEFQRFQTYCARAGFDLDLGIHLKNLIAFATGQSRFQTVNRLTEEALRASWQEASQGMEFALNFIQKNAEIHSPTLLSSPFILITLGAFGHRHDYRLTPQQGDTLKKWILLANAKGRYSRGSSETLLDQDLASLRDTGETSDLLTRLSQQVGRLDITPGELEGRNQRSALFKTMFLAFRAQDARDWTSNLVIALDHRGSQHNLQFHHIFPKAILKGQQPNREIDDIANLVFISGRTNRSLNKTPPNQYLPALIQRVGIEALHAQAIPTDPRLWEIDAYPEFLQTRRALIAQTLTNFLNSTP